MSPGLRPILYLFLPAFPGIQNRGPRDGEKERSKYDDIAYQPGY